MSPGSSSISRSSLDSDLAPPLFSREHRVSRKLAVPIMVVIGALIATGFGLAGLGHHFGWWHAPSPPLHTSLILLSGGFITASTALALLSYRIYQFQHPHFGPPLSTIKDGHGPTITFQSLNDSYEE